MANKYNNKKLYVGGETFDSKKEFTRWHELQLLQRAGTISRLERQVKFILIPGTKSPEGKSVLPVTYIADFCYVQDGQQVVEDVKPDNLRWYKKTAAWTVYQLKKKLLYHTTGIWIKEV